MPPRVFPAVAASHKNIIECLSSDARYKSNASELPGRIVADSKALKNKPARPVVISDMASLLQFVDFGDKISFVYVIAADGLEFL